VTAGSAKTAACYQLSWLPAWPRSNYAEIFASEVLDSRLSSGQTCAARREAQEQQ